MLFRCEGRAKILCSSQSGRRSASSTPINSNLDLRLLVRHLLHAHLTDMHDLVLAGNARAAARHNANVLRIAVLERGPHAAERAGSDARHGRDDGLLADLDAHLALGARVGLAGFDADGVALALLHAARDGLRERDLGAGLLADDIDAAALRVRDREDQAAVAGGRPRAGLDRVVEVGEGGVGKEVEVKVGAGVIATLVGGRRGRVGVWRWRRGIAGVGGRRRHRGGRRG